MAERRRRRAARDDGVTVEYMPYYQWLIDHSGASDAADASPAGRPSAPPKLGRPATPRRLLTRR